MKEKHWKILSLVMLIMTIGFSIAAFLEHSDAIPAAMICASATLSSYAVTKRVK